jgi:hypothetical protein
MKMKISTLTKGIIRILEDAVAEATQRDLHEAEVLNECFAKANFIHDYCDSVDIGYFEELQLSLSELAQTNTHGFSLGVKINLCLELARKASQHSVNIICKDLLCSDLV